MHVPLPNTIVVQPRSVQTLSIVLRGFVRPGRSAIARDYSERERTCNSASAPFRRLFPGEIALPCGNPARRADSIPKGATLVPESVTASRLPRSDGESRSRFADDVAVMDVNAQARQDVIEEIERLTLLERQISDQRNELHARIDGICQRAPLTPEDTRFLDELEALEFDISARRARLHLRIDDLRAAIGLPRWRQGRDISTAA